MPEKGNQPSFLNPDGSLNPKVIGKVAEDKIKAQMEANKKRDKENADRLAAQREAAQRRGEQHSS